MSPITLTYPPGSDAYTGVTAGTARALITRALLLCGTIAEGETPSAALADQARAVLNDLIDEWRTDRLLLFSQQRSVFDFVAAQADYTLGPGGDFAMVRPVFIDAITLLDSTADDPFEFAPLHAYTDEEWAGVPMKDLAGLPQGFALDRAYPLMTVSFHPVPDVTTYQPVLYTPGGILTSVPTLDTPLAVPPGLTRALRYKLAAELSMIPGFAKAPRGDLAKEAALAIARFQSQNVQPSQLGCDTGLLSGGISSFNWRTGA